MALLTTPAVRLNPSATKTATPQNYLDLSQMNYFRNELPQFINKQIQGRYGSQMLDTFLERKGLRLALSSDVATWMEEERLTQLIIGATRSGDIFTSAGHTFRIGEILTAWNADGTVLKKGRISATTATTFTASCSGTGWGTLALTGISCHTGTSEFLKGSEGQQESLNTTYQQFTARPCIVKEKVTDNRTNLTQDSWVSVKAPDGTVGNLWYDVNKNGCEARFRNAREFSHFNSEEWTGDLLAATYRGKQGLIAAMLEGNQFSGLVSNLTDARSVVDRLDKQGQLPNNTIYANLDLGFGFDTFLASQNINGQAWGMFDNEENKKLDLSFKGFSLANYNFNYDGLQILKDPTGHGARTGITKINGMLIPDASQSVKDVLTGKMSTRPMLHVLYRAKGDQNRSYEMVMRDWAKGTEKADIVTTEFQSEEATCLIGRNNTLIFVGA